MLLEEMIHKINSVIWSPPLVFFCLFSGLYFSIRTRFIQFRSFKKVFKILFQKPNIQNEKKGISSFTAFCLSISGRVGTGNIAGVATAIAYGGPGALFWMWVVALLGASSAFIEAVLAQIYRERHDGHYVGGPSYYIKEGLKNKKLAVIFALVTILATGFCLPSVQSNSMTSAISFALAAQGNSSIKESYIGFFIVLFTGLVIFGGKKRIGQAANVLVPFMFVFYMLFAFLLILIHYQEIPSMLILIFKSAFGLDAQFGAILGQSILFGVKRGIFSNEAGQGTAPHAAASANVNHPVEQGLVQSFSVYVDTLLICTATGFMILLTQKYNVYDASGVSFIVENLNGVRPGPQFTQAAMDLFMLGFGKVFVSIALSFFAFTTILYYAYMAEANVVFLFKRPKKPIYMVRILLLVSLFLGSLSKESIFWELGDIGVGAMAWINLIVLFLLQRPAISSLKEYDRLV